MAFDQDATAEHRLSNASEDCRWRNLRRAAAALCLMLAGIFVVLWNRSYRYSDSFDGPLPRTYVVELATRNGSLHAAVSGPAFKRHWWHMSSQPLPQAVPTIVRTIPGAFAFRYGSMSGPFYLITPLWFPALVLATMAAALGIRPPYQFGLRALLIATTYVAAVLGLAVAFGR